MRCYPFNILAIVLDLSIVLVTLSSHPVQAAVTTFYVDDSNPCPGAGTMGDPFCTIQAGIDAASSGDTVQVAAGTYFENITMKSGVVIQGAGQDDCSIDGTGSSGNVVTANSVDSAAKLDGFTIKNGSTYGMYNSFFSSPTVANCTFTGNSRSGMQNFWSSSPIVTNCTFSGNTVAGSGGGMSNINSSPTVTNCTFTGNTAQDYGGGMYNEGDSSPTVTSCIFSGNTAGELGGGMYNSGGTLYVTNCTFWGNNNSGQDLDGSNGSGMYNSGGTLTVTNCTFAENSGIHTISIVDSGSLALTNSILWGNVVHLFDIGKYTISSVTVNYSDVQWGGVGGGTGNINADPMFVDQANGDLHLQQDSPCIDAGDNSAPALPATDIDGDNRRINNPMVVDTGNGTPPIVDMGADEFVWKVRSIPAIPSLLLNGDN